MKRIEELDATALNSEQASVYAAIAAGPRGGVRGPLAVWLHRPGLASHAQALGQYCRYETCLPPRLSELAIIVTGRIWQSQYEWDAHVPLALQAGIASETVDVLAKGEAPHFDHADEQAVHDFVTALHRERYVSDALYERTVKVLGQNAVVDLVGIAGYYTLISMTINTFGIESQSGGAHAFTLTESSR
jgi:4-carboxymuconolactone decarboxylase